MIKTRVCLALSLSLLLMPGSMLGTIAAEISNAQDKTSNSNLSKASGAQKGHSLFLLGPGEGNIEDKLGSPAAVLTIHPSIEYTDKALIANRSNRGKRKYQPLVAQLAPDQMLAQGNPDYIGATVIPPVVSGAVDLEELKTSNVIELKIAQSRTFKLKNKIVRISISDPSNSRANSCY